MLSRICWPRIISIGNTLLPMSIVNPNQIE
nr:MAG TPA: hypothetical protein [Microviridae sp.]